MYCIVLYLLRTCTPQDFPNFHPPRPDSVIKPGRHRFLSSPSSLIIKHTMGRLVYLVQERREEGCPSGVWVSWSKKWLKKKFPRVFFKKNCKGLRIMVQQLLLYRFFSANFMKSSFQRIPSPPISPLPELCKEPPSLPSVVVIRYFERTEERERERS